MICWWWAKDLNGDISTRRCSPPPSETEWDQDSTYRKDQRDTSPYSLRAIQLSLGAKEEILLALAFPGDDGGAIQKHLDRFACR